MKFSTQEEYGLRLLLRVGKDRSLNGITIPELSQLEGLSEANVAKILRILRIAGFVESSRGQTGGYKLTRPPGEIVVGEVMALLGGRLFEAGFCEIHSGIESICTNTIDCSIRSLWRSIQSLVDSVLMKTTLNDLLGNEEEVTVLVSSYIDESQLPEKKN